MSAASAMAARQTFPRDQVAAFDASARAWIRSADEAKSKHQKQLELIVKNIPASVSAGSSTYSKVVTAWRAAMQGLEDLLKGMPQQISDGAILLALSAWHLYPDMIVLRNKPQKVKFSDPLFPPTGVITVGLESVDPTFDQGIKWSLTLSHLRYYGDPVKVEVKEDNSRVSMEQLRIVGLGAFLGAWGVPPKEMLGAVQWIYRVWTHLWAHFTIAEMTHDLQWLLPLANASSQLTDSSSEESKAYQMLLRFGSRRHSVFLGTADGIFPDEQNIPYFGLCNPFVLDALAAESAVEFGVRYLRGVAASLGTTDSDTVLVYTERRNKLKYKVFATATPHRLKHGGQKHIRWIHVHS